MEMDSKKHFEEVSAQTITSLLKYMHTVQVRTFDSCVNLVCFVDPVQSVSFYILLHLLVAWIWVFNVSDTTFLWIASNIALTAEFFWPLFQDWAESLTLKLPLVARLCEKKEK